MSNYKSGTQLVKKDSELLPRLTIKVPWVFFSSTIVLKKSLSTTFQIG